MKNVYVLNGAIPLERSRDKLRALQVLSAVGVGMPRTSIAFSSALVNESLSHVGGTPAIIKSLKGTQGIGVGIVESDRSATSIIQAFSAQNVSVLVQEFVEEAGNADIRVLIVGDEIVGAMQRTGADGDFRSNLHRGGNADMVDLTEEEQSQSLRAARAMGLNVCGVDFLRSERGPKIMEVNSSPGLEGIEKNALMGTIVSPFGGERREVLARKSGTIIGATTLPVVREGDALFHIAQIDPNPDDDLQATDLLD